VPERFFTIMDLYLEDGGWRIATPDALAAYEGHRAEDRLMTVVSLYILGRLREARVILGELRVDQILGSRTLQRGRLLMLLMGLHGLTRLPRIPLLAHLFYRRWHARGQARTGGIRWVTGSA
jgi:hypothetical protein